MQHVAINIDEFERVHAEAVLILKNAESMLERVEALIERMQAAEAVRLHAGLNSAASSARPTA